MMKPYRSCKVTLFFADSEYEFRLPLKRIAELEERCGAPVGLIWKRVCLTGDYHATDLVETVRLGLIGGGLEPLKAKNLVDRYCDEWPLEVWHQHAIAILGACIEGYDDPDADKEKPEPDGKKPTAAGDSSTLPPATP